MCKKENKEVPIKKRKKKEKENKEACGLERISWIV